MGPHSRSETRTNKRNYITKVLIYLTIFFVDCAMFHNTYATRTTMVKTGYYYNRGNPPGQKFYYPKLINDGLFINQTNKDSISHNIKESNSATSDSKTVLPIDTQSWIMNAPINVLQKHTGLQSHGERCNNTNHLFQDMDDYRNRNVTQNNETETDYLKNCDTILDLKNDNRDKRCATSNRNSIVLKQPPNLREQVNSNIQGDIRTPCCQTINQLLAETMKIRDNCKCSPNEIINFPNTDNYFNGPLPIILHSGYNNQLQNYNVNDPVINDVIRNNNDLQVKDLKSDVTGESINNNLFEENVNTLNKSVTERSVVQLNKTSQTSLQPDTENIYNLMSYIKGNLNEDNKSNDAKYMAILNDYLNSNKDENTLEKPTNEKQFPVKLNLKTKTITEESTVEAILNDNITYVITESSIKNTTETETIRKNIVVMNNDQMAKKLEPTEHKMVDETPVTERTGNENSTIYDGNETTNENRNKEVHNDIDDKSLDSQMEVKEEGDETEKDLIHPESKLLSSDNTNIENESRAKTDIQKGLDNTEDKAIMNSTNETDSNSSTTIYDGNETINGNRNKEVHNIKDIDDKSLDSQMKVMEESDGTEKDSFHLESKLLSSDNTNSENESRTDIRKDLDNTGDKAIMNSVNETDSTRSTTEYNKTNETDKWETSENRNNKEDHVNADGNEDGSNHENESEQNANDGTKQMIHETESSLVGKSDNETKFSNVKLEENNEDNWEMRTEAENSKSPKLQNPHYTDMNLLFSSNDTSSTYNSILATTESVVGSNKKETKWENNSDTTYEYLSNTPMNETHGTKNENERYKTEKINDKKSYDGLNDTSQVLSLLYDSHTSTNSPYKGNGVETFVISTDDPSNYKLNDTTEQNYDKMKHLIDNLYLENDTTSHEEKIYTGKNDETKDEKIASTTNETFTTNKQSKEITPGVEIMETDILTTNPEIRSIAFDHETESLNDELKNRSHYAEHSNLESKSSNYPNNMNIKVENEYNTYKSETKSGVNSYTETLPLQNTNHVTSTPTELGLQNTYKTNTNKDNTKISSDNAFMDNNLNIDNNVNNIINTETSNYQMTTPITTEKYIFDNNVDQTSNIKDLIDNNNTIIQNMNADSSTYAKSNNDSNVNMNADTSMIISNSDNNIFDNFSSTNIRNEIQENNKQNDGNNSKLENGGYNNKQSNNDNSVSQNYDSSLEYFNSSPDKITTKQTDFYPSVQPTRYNLMSTFYDSSFVDSDKESDESKFNQTKPDYKKLYYQDLTHDTSATSTTDKLPMFEGKNNNNITDNHEFDDIQNTGNVQENRLLFGTTTRQNAEDEKNTSSAPFQDFPDKINNQLSVTPIKDDAYNLIYENNGRLMTSASPNNDSFKYEVKWDEKKSSDSFKNITTTKGIVGDNEQNTNTQDSLDNMKSNDPVFKHGDTSIQLQDNPPNDFETLENYKLPKDVIDSDLNHAPSVNDNYSSMGNVMNDNFNSKRYTTEGSNESHINQHSIIDYENNTANQHGYLEEINELNKTTTEPHQFIGNTKDVNHGKNGTDKNVNYSDFIKNSAFTSELPRIMDDYVNENYNNYYTKTITSQEVSGIPINASHYNPDDVGSTENHDEVKNSTNSSNKELVTETDVFNSDNEDRNISKITTPREVGNQSTEVKYSTVSDNISQLPQIDSVNYPVITQYQNNVSRYDTENDIFSTNSNTTIIPEYKRNNILINENTDKISSEYNEANSYNTKYDDNNYTNPINEEKTNDTIFESKTTPEQLNKPNNIITPLHKQEHNSQVENELMGESHQSEDNKLKFPELMPSISISDVNEKNLAQNEFRAILHLPIWLSIKNISLINSTDSKFYMENNGQKIELGIIPNDPSQMTRNSRYALTNNSDHSKLYNVNNTVYLNSDETQNLKSIVSEINNPFRENKPYDKVKGGSKNWDYIKSDRFNENKSRHDNIDFIDPSVYIKQMYLGNKTETESQNRRKITIPIKEENILTNNINNKNANKRLPYVSPNPFNKLWKRNKNVANSLYRQNNWYNPFNRYKMRNNIASDVSKRDKFKWQNRVKLNSSRKKRSLNDNIPKILSELLNENVTKDQNIIDIIYTSVKKLKELFQN